MTGHGMDEDRKMISAGVARALVNVARAMLNPISAYFDALDSAVVAVLKLFGIERPSIQFGAAPVDIDQRLAKIEVARAALVESLQAVDFLKSQAEENKQELARALETIAQLEIQKSTKQRELETLHRVAELDTGALKKLFAVPTEARIWRERIYGLASGVIGSLIAAGVWAYLHKA
jgi:hypothetical protein